MENMKNKVLLAFLTTVVMLSGCTKETDYGDGRDDSVTRTYRTSFTDYTKTTLQEDGQVCWQNGDAIRYYSSDRGGIRTFSVEEDSHDTYLRLKMSRYDDYLVAVYGGTSLEKNTRDGFAIDGVAAPEQDGSFEKAHVSVAMTTDVMSESLSFSSIAGLVQFTLRRPDVQYVQLIAADGSKIAGDGTVKVSFSGGDVTAKLSSSAGSSCIKVAVDGPGTYFVSTLPCTVNGFTIQLIGESGALLDEVSSEKTLALRAGSVVNLGILDNVEAINPSFVPIDWSDVSLSGYSDDSDFFSITFKGRIPDIQVGSVLSVDAGTSGSIRIVRKVETNGNTVSLTTIEGNLCDVFANTTIVLSTESSPSYASTKAAGTENVIYAKPVACIYEKDGQTCRLSLDKGTRGGTVVRGDLLTWNPDLSGQVMWEKGGCKLSLEKASFNIDVDLVMTMNFGNRNPFYAAAEAMTLYRSDALSVSAYLNGAFNTTQILRFDAQGSTSYDNTTTIKKDLFPPKMLVFFAGDVPVFVKVGADLDLDTHFDAKGEMYYRMGYTDRANAKVGINWSQSGGITPITSFSNQLELVYPTVDGKGCMNAKARLYPKFNLMVYSFVGPTFAVKPYLSAHVEGGFHATLFGASEDYAAWSAYANTGVDATAGLRLDFLGQTYSYDTPELNLCDKLLYRSPEEIVSNQSAGYKAKVGQSNSLSFTVKDYNALIGGCVATHLPQIVKFTGDGSISKTYGICEDGQVTVSWIPEKSGDQLKASLYSYTGQVISECVIDTEETHSCPDGHHPHAIDLGLPSGTKWACCNVGASTPEGYGGYYAWGETSEKSCYDWSTYKYGSSWNNCVNIGSDIAGTGYDVAHVLMGGSWWMPTYEQQMELMNYCTRTWTQQNGVNGILVTGPNGGQIFLPAAGYRWDDSLLEGSYGDYWSSTLYPIDYYRAYSLGFDSRGWGWGYYDRSRGRSVRAVCP